jgi:hypothetical protein
MISVVIPCVILLTERPSPSPRKLPYEPLWMSMKPGATTSPRASIRCRALAARRVPGGAMRAMRSPVMPTSP